MKMTKQLRDGVLLGVALVVLVVVAYLTLKGNGAPATASTRTSAAAADPAKDAGEKKQAVPDDMSWVDPLRLGSAIGEVQGGRNPFEDLLPTGSTTPGRATHQSAAPVPPRPASGAGTASRFSVPDGHASGLMGGGTLPPLETPVQQPVTVQWITRADLEKALAKERLAVKVLLTRQQGTYTLSGPRDDVQEARAMVAELDVAPPVPDFVLTGVITTPVARYAVITVAGTTYSLYEGETVPALGWTVAKITATGVEMVKGKQHAPIRLGGGKA